MAKILIKRANIYLSQRKYISDDKIGVTETKKKWAQSNLDTTCNKSLLKYYRMEHAHAGLMSTIDNLIAKMICMCNIAHGD